MLKKKAIATYVEKMFLKEGVTEERPRVGPACAGDSRRGVITTAWWSERQAKPDHLRMRII